ncbi:MAG: hypothetical protein C0598_13630 [Marinilabiliales bacterium]|nr:MAG: hypothetical protein C0598_13630 [Marinilabiliales bacterium]
MNNFGSLLFNNHTIMKRLNIIYVLIVLLTIGSYPLFSQNDSLASDKYLMVLDLQDFYLKNSLNIKEAETYINKVNDLIYKTKNENIIYIRSVHKVLNLSLKSPFIYVTLDTSAMQLYENLSIVNDNIFTKDEGNAFSVEDLNVFLEKNNVKEIVIVGLMAEECIYKTSIGGIENGFEISIVPQAIIGKSPKSKEKIFNKLKSKGVRVQDYY